MSDPIDPVNLEEKPGTIDPDDAAQAFVEGIITKIDKEPLTREEACALACGRTQTVIMENVAELAQMAQDDTESDIARMNAFLLAQVYATYADEMKSTVKRIMEKHRNKPRILVVSDDANVKRIAEALAKRGV